MSRAQFMNAIYDQMSDADPLALVFVEDGTTLAHKRLENFYGPNRHRLALLFDAGLDLAETESLQELSRVHLVTSSTAIPAPKCDVFVPCTITPVNAIIIISLEIATSVYTIEVMEVLRDGQRIKGLEPMTPINQVCTESQLLPTLVAGFRAGQRGLAFRLS